MSIINQALKKAQKVKESRNIEFTEVMVSGERKKDIRSSKKILCSLFFIILIFSLFIIYSSLEPNNYEQEPVSEYVIPPPGDKNIMIPETLYERAKQFHNIGKISEAKKLYLEILKLDPGHTDALNNLGVICMSEKEYSSARKYFEKAVVLKPGYAIPYYNMACLISIGEENEESMMYLKKAVSLNQAVREWARKDTDLKTLRGTPEFDAIIEEDFD